jgi:hypothetical protein
MKLTAAFVFAGFLGTAVMGYGSDIVIDNFSCPDSVSVTGTSFNSNYISCPGSLGGERQDFFVYLNGPSDSVSTINSNPPAGAITGTFGPGITGYEGMGWGVTPTTVGTLPNLDFVGDSLLVQIQSDTGGTLLVGFGNLTNSELFSATFAGSPSYQDVLIPFTNPTVEGTGYNLSEVDAFLLDVSLNASGGTWTIDGVDAVTTPEPSTLLLTGICFLGILTRSLWRRSSR